MTDWLLRKLFTAHSGESAFFKIEEEGLSFEEIATFARIIAPRYPTCTDVVSVPRGGDRLAEALQPYLAHHAGDDILIVDDVYTTGSSMNHQKIEVYAGNPEGNVHGVVMFARNPIKPDDAWIKPVFQMWEC